MPCPYCNARNALTEDMIGQHSFSIECKKCHETYSVDMQFIEKQKPLRRKSKFEIGDSVYIINKRHEFHMEPARVVQKDYMHCRVRMRRGRKNIMFWVPESWLQKGF
jgi:hypothetical protein